MARSKEMFIHELQIQGPSIDIIEGIRYSWPSMQMPPVAGDGCIQKWHGIEKGTPQNEAEVDYVVALILGWIERQINEKWDSAV